MNNVIKTSEKTITKQICDYLKYQYKDIIFTMDASGIRLTMGQAVQMKSLRSSKALPDLLILQPNKYYHSLFIEIKKDKSEVFKKDGSLKGIKHIEEQAEMLEMLNAKGFYASWGFGFDHCREIIDNYVSSV